jgi:hypothetical protein
VRYNELKQRTTEGILSILKGGISGSLQILVDIVKSRRPSSDFRLPGDGRRSAGRLQRSSPIENAVPSTYGGAISRKSIKSVRPNTSLAEKHNNRMRDGECWIIAGLDHDIISIA